jgi:DNA helicase-2/ATP-dependent DNA helicase PcrA
MIIHLEDEEALRRSINYPKRGIGETTVEKIIELARNHKITAWEVLCSADKYPEQFNVGTIKKLFLYRDIIRHLGADKDKTDAFTKAREIAMGSGIMKELREGKLSEEISKYENMQELLNAIKEFTEAAATNGESDTLEAYMANVSLLTNQDIEKEEERNRVTLMTMHSAKGLEFKHVYIAGMEDTLFPSPMCTGSARELEEERRLFYVALTRAEKQATLSYALNRYKWGNLEKSNPSRFIREVDTKFLHYPQTGGKPFNAVTTNVVQKTLIPRDEPPNYRLKKLVKTSNYQTSETMEFAEGDKVHHERFGAGEILSIEGEAPNATASVRFENNNVRKLLLRFAKLRKIY